MSLHPSRTSRARIKGAHFQSWPTQVSPNSFSVAGLIELPRVVAEPSRPRRSSTLVQGLVDPYSLVPTKAFTPLTFPVHTRLLVHLLASCFSVQKGRGKDGVVCDQGRRAASITDDSVGDSVLFKDRAWP